MCWGSRMGLFLHVLIEARSQVPLLRWRCRNSKSDRTLALSHFQSPSRVHLLAEPKRGQLTKEPLKCDLQRSNVCITGESLERKANQGWEAVDKQPTSLLHSRSRHCTCSRLQALVSGHLSSIFPPDLIGSFLPVIYYFLPYLLFLPPSIPHLFSSSFFVVSLFLDEFQ